ncbi:MAG: hypothetical protein MR449_08380 [Spirochaetia bacterium]|nr:hypothetical protein [Spirochaetia bacterium]
MKRFIGLLLLIVLIVVIAGFNLQNTCNIWIIKTFKGIPVFYALLASFILGVLVTIPIMLVSNGEKSKAKKESKSEKEIKSEKEQEDESLGEKTDSKSDGIEK